MGASSIPKEVRSAHKGPAVKITILKADPPVPVPVVSTPVPSNLTQDSERVNDTPTPETAKSNDDSGPKVREYLRTHSRHKKVLWQPTAETLPSQVQHINILTASPINTRNQASQSQQTSPLSSSLAPTPTAKANARYMMKRGSKSMHNLGPLTQSADSQQPLSEYPVRVKTKKVEEQIKSRYKLMMPRRGQISGGFTGYVSKTPPQETNDSSPSIDVNHRGSRKVKSVFDLSKHPQRQESPTKNSSVGLLPGLQKPMQQASGAEYRPRKPVKKSSFAESVALLEISRLSDTQKKGKSRAEYPWTWKGEHGILK